MGNSDSPSPIIGVRGICSGLTVNVTLEMLRSIPGIGPTIGIEILKVYPTIVRLAEASQSELAAIPKVGKERAKTIYNPLRGKN